MSTGISWTDETWNPVVGCDKVSQGCKFCYAKTLHDMRHKAYSAGKLQMLPQYAKPFESVQLLPDRLADPLRWQRPRRIFVNSMSDLFHERLDNEEIAAIFGVMIAAKRHTFQVLTKRAGSRDGRASRLREWFDWLNGCFHAMRTRRTFLLSAAASALDAAGEGVWASHCHELTRETAEAWPPANVIVGVSVENRKHGVPRIADLRNVPVATRMLSI